MVNPLTKSKKPSVRIIVSNDCLQLRWWYKGERKYLSLGLTATPANYKLADLKARQIELELLTGKYDESLNTYRNDRSKKKIIPIKREVLDLQDIWEKYSEYKTPQLSQSTVATDLVRYSHHIDKLPAKTLEDAIVIRDHLVKTTSPNTAKRCLMHFSAACNWAVRSGLISHNPFRGMSEEIKIPKAKNEENDINPFSEAEINVIITKFEQSSYYNYYAPFITFLFQTGCRPSEAVGLLWKDVASNYSYIFFTGAVTRSLEGLKRKEGLKSQSKRKFPCNEKLRNLLISQRINKEVTPDDLVFPSPEGCFIDINNLRNRGWKKILEEAGLEYRKLYQTRHSWITLCLAKNVPVKQIAKWAGNTPAVIWDHYAGFIDNIAPPEF
jgi:integrase